MKGEGEKGKDDGVGGMRRKRMRWMKKHLWDGEEVGGGGEC